MQISNQKPDNIVAAQEIEKVAQVLDKSLHLHQLNRDYDQGRKRPECNQTVDCIEPSGKPGLSGGNASRQRGQDQDPQNCKVDAPQNYNLPQGDREDTQN